MLRPTAHLLPLVSLVTGFAVLLGSGCGEAAARPETHANTQVEQPPVPVGTSAPAVIPQPRAAIRHTVEPFLGLPAYSQLAMPTLLSQTGVFSDLATLTPVAGLLPYEVNAALWTDNARKQRWLLVPQSDRPDGENGGISFSPNGEWYFPNDAGNDCPAGPEPKQGSHIDPAILHPTTGAVAASR